MPVVPSAKLACDWLLLSQFFYWLGAKRGSRSGLHRGGGGVDNVLDPAVLLVSAPFQLRLFSGGMLLDDREKKKKAMMGLEGKAG